MILLLTIGAASADTAERLTAAITMHVAQATATPQADVEVLHLGATWESCAEPERETLQIVARSGEDYLGPTDLRVTVLDGEQICASHSVKPRLARWVSLPVAAESAAPGALIEATTKRTRLDTSGSPSVRLEDGPFIALTTLRSGDPITTARARPQPDADGGRPILVEFRKGALTIRCDGVLVGDATIGEPARARGSTTGRVVLGTLTTPDHLVSGG